MMYIKSLSPLQSKINRSRLLNKKDEEGNIETFVFKIF